MFRVHRHTHQKWPLTTNVNFLYDKLSRSQMSEIVKKASCWDCQDLDIGRVQGWRSGESTRLPPMWPGFDSQTRRHRWVEFVGSLLCTERFFSGYSGFPFSSKTNIWFDLRWSVNLNVQCPQQLVLQRKKIKHLKQRLQDRETELFKSFTIGYHKDLLLRIMFHHFSKTSF